MPLEKKIHSSQSLNQKLHYVIKMFAKNYFCILMADFQENDIAVSHISEPVLPLFSQKLSGAGDFRELIAFYCSQYVLEQDRAAFLTQMDPNEIQRRLTDSGTYGISFHQLYQDRSCPAEIMLADVSDARDGSQCIVAARFMEDIVRQQTALKKQDDMVKTLVHDYNAIYHIDLDADTFLILQAQNVVNEDLYDYAYRNMPYYTAMEKFINEMVREEDRTIMLKISSCDYIKERLEKEAGFSIRFQVKPTRGMQYFEMRVIRAKTDESGHFAIMTSRNVDEMVKEELRVQHEIEIANKKLSQALAAAEHANESKSNFISNVSHDMRTPLNAILGYDKLALETEDTACRTEYLTKIQEAGETLLALINDTLDLQKIENGVVTLHPVPVSCREIAERVLTVVRPMMDEKKIHFTYVHPKADGVVISADAMRVEEIFINLLNNAAKFTPEGGEVLLKIECERETEKEVYGKLVVRDSGIGISPDFISKIYEPFAQERTERTVETGGSGLGLSIVKRLIDLMHGRIEVKSAPGSGTEFAVCLTFPKAELTEVRAEEKIEKQTVLQGKKILVCEDNEMNREIVIAILKKSGMEVIAAVNGKEAVTRYTQSAQGEISAILMDIRMPVMDGYEAAKCIRESNHPDAGRVPIIALTADVYTDDINKSRKCGMNGHLSKPIDTILLLKMLRKEISIFISPSLVRK